MKFFICGFTGAGKTTLLKELERESKLKSFQFFDLDELVSRNIPNNMTIADFIHNEGFEKFRSLEIDELKRLDGENDILVSLGGGAFNEKTKPILKNWQGLWLDTPFEKCVERIQGDSNRPVALKSLDEKRDLYFQRLNFFKEVFPVKNGHEALAYILEKSENIT